MSTILSWKIVCVWGMGQYHKKTKMRVKVPFDSEKNKYVILIAKLVHAIRIESVFMSVGSTRRYQLPYFSFISYLNQRGCLPCYGYQRSE
jgi:hypothetical protein